MPSKLAIRKRGVKSLLPGVSKQISFQIFLKSEIEQEFLTVIGKLFHTRGPATENALEAMLDPAKGMARTSQSEDRSDLLFTRMWSLSAR